MSNKEFKDILASLDELLNKAKQANNVSYLRDVANFWKNIDKKSKKLDELIVLIESGVLSSYKGPELQGLTDLMKAITKEFKPASELEIEVFLF